MWFRKIIMIEEKSALRIEVKILFLHTEALEVFKKRLQRKAWPKATPK